MEIVWLGIAVIAAIVWAWIAITQRLGGARHQRRARSCAATGNWEQAALAYKLAILQRLDSATKLQELTAELAAVYRSRGMDHDLTQLLKCPPILKTLGAGTGNQKRKNELILELFKETGEFLNKLPGPPLPDK